MYTGRTALLALVLLAGLGLVLSWLTRPSVPPGVARLQLRVVDFADLNGWARDSQAAALTAFLRSCVVLNRQQETRVLGASGFAGTVGDWRAPCSAAARVAPSDDAAARVFFQKEFVPVAATTQFGSDGLFTGYYEAALNGSRRQNERYRIPIYARPPELVTVDLGRFDPELRHRRIAGKVEDSRLVPLPTREDIVAGAYGGRGMELLWVDDPVDAFFLHIQGSGRVALDDGAVLRLGYAAQNGHRYFAIGRELIRRAEVSREQMSMQAIRTWLAANPGAGQVLMNMNPSFVFFRVLEGDGPLGAQGVALTAGRSLAVDRRFVPLGIPAWLQATTPTANGDEQRLHRLMVAQDTGGAIRGPVRGDVFWGFGDAATAIAGRMKHPGRWFFLLPRAVVARGLPNDVAR